MKKSNLLILTCAFPILIMAQQNPTGTSVGTLPPSVNNSSFAWFRGGNLPTGGGGTNNIFGTMWNSPIYTYSNSQPASKLNGSLAYTVNGYNGNRNGFMLLGIQTAYSQNTFNVPNYGAFSLLHLNGNEGTFVQDGGYRPWMRTGVSFTDNNDFSYLGIRKVGNGTDITETVLSWSDNSGNGFPGPDDMVFRFTAGGNGNNTISNNLTDVSDLDGLHVARFTGNGEFGIGNTFGAGNPLYVRPASLQHLSLSNMRSVYTQYTNRNTAVGSGTAETASDGLRLGINGDNNVNVNGNALIYNQENRHLLFSTNNNTNFVNIGNGTTLERMRVTAIAAPTSLPGGGYGVYSPAGLNGNLTRVAISHDPQSPVTRPLSLLHLGYNTGANSLFPTATDGWRNWMDIGMFVSNGTDNTYLGLKQESGIGGDRQDAVLNWGDNDASNPLFGPDNLRFIFTSTTTGAGNTPANSNNGLETMRINPDTASTMGGNFGMVGIGDWTTALNITNPIDAKLDIDGDLRIRTVTKDTTLLQVLVIDSNDRNRVHWRSVADLGNVTANNGVSVDTNNVVQLGVPCTDSLGNPDTTNIFANAFTTDRVVANRNFNFWFGSRNNETGGVGVGGQPIATTFCNTGNTFEISANNKNTKYGNTNASGLRLTKLTSASPVIANGVNGVNNAKVLSVDSLGDVVLVEAVGGSGSDDQNLTLTGTTLSIEDGNSVDLSLIDTDTDQQTLSFNTGTSQLCISNGNCVTIPTGTGGSSDHDWYVEGTTTIPSNINQDIYTMGNVAINSNSAGNNSLFITNNTNPTSILSKTTTTGLTTSATGVDIDVSTNSSNGNIAYGGRVSGGSGGNNFGVRVDALNSPNQNYGINATAASSGVTALQNFGGFFFALNASIENMGVKSQAGSSLANAINYGGFFSVQGNSSNKNYGVWAMADNSNPLNRAGKFVGKLESNSALIISDKMFKTNVENIKGATDVLRKLKPSTYKMDVNGFPQFNFENRNQYGFIAQEVEFVLPELVHESYMPSELDSLGNEISPAVNYKSLNYNALIPITVQAVIELNERLDKATLSDQNVKTNVQNLANSLDKVKQMRGVSYEWSSSAQNDMNLDSLQHIGFIAQEIAAIEPLLTFTDDSSLVHVNYDRVAPLLVESVKELDNKILAKDSIIEDLETRLAYLENCIRNANICTEGNRTINNELNNNTNHKSIELININSIILDQNLPNPFAENTVINYNIPAEIAEAKLLFYDLNGRIIKELIIEERGESKLTVYGTNLKTGIYTYSLIADGELIATKKMVKK